QKAVAMATVAVLAGAGIYEARQSLQLRKEIRTLRQQQMILVEQISELQSDSEDRARKLASSNEENRDNGELLRLRGEVGSLRRELADLRLKNIPSKQAHQAGASSNPGSGPRQPVAKVLVTHTKQPQLFSEEQILAMIAVKPGDSFDEGTVNR